MENLVNPRPSAASFLPHSRAVALRSGWKAHKPDYRKDDDAGPCDVFTSEMISPRLEHG
jgi:hypothetical protein